VNTRVDSLGLWAAVRSMPDQLEVAVDLARSVDHAPRGDEVDHIVFMGVGSSGFAGDVVRAVAGPMMPVPVVLSKGYECPLFVNPRSLVFAVSVSGNTEETIEAASSAEAAGAQMVAITGGGALGKLADGWGAAVYGIDKSIPTPRSAIGAICVPALVALEEAGLFRGAEQWISLAVAQMRDRLAEGDAANAIARRIGRTFPLVYGAGDLGSAAATRWKSQINENAKTPAFANTVPELCHNELAGWGQHGDVTRQVLTLLTLRHDFEHPQATRKFDFIEQSLDEVVSERIEIRAKGEGQLAQLFDLVTVGDLVSLHLAEAEDVDPGPVPVIDEMRAHSAG
jgi:glucose/mannose-6-phosphate isomerase